MLRFFSAVVAVCALNVAFFLPRAHAAATTQVHTVRVMIRFSGQPLAADPNLKARDKATLWRLRFDPTLLATRQFGSAMDRYQSQEIAYIKAQGVDLHVDRQLKILFNGIAADLPRTQIGKLEGLKNVAAVLPDPKVFVPQIASSLPLISTPQAWNVLGGEATAGHRLFIADLDTGIDISNPCFRPDGFAPPPFGRRADTNNNLSLTNNKVIVARAFGGTSSGTYSAADTVGHGTFTAAIEACDANTSTPPPTPSGSTTSGVAPDAYLGNYNVFPDIGGDQIVTDPIIAGLEAALQDGADIANLSLGGSLGPGDPRLDPENQSIQLATAAGMVVVVSAGNGGPTAQTVSSPGTAPDAISVGASTNSTAVFSAARFGGPDLPDTLSHVRASQDSHGFTGIVGPAQMVYVGLGRKPKDDPDNPNADDFAGKDLQGKIAVIKRGTIFFDKKINNAAAAGAVGVVVFDNVGELQLITMSTPTATLPAMMISQKDGQALLDYMQAHPDATATLDSNKVQLDVTPNLLSDFSARGYGPRWEIKPDIVAPGQDIYAATETNDPAGEMYDPTGFTAADGTSFSSPHVAGAAALVLQEHPKMTPAAVKAVMMETADPSAVTDPDVSHLGVMEQGSGLLNVHAAVTAPAYALPASVSLGEVNLAGGAFHQSLTFTVSDIGGGSGSWDVSSAANNTAPGFNLNLPSTVNVPGGGQATLTVPVSIDANTAPGDYEGYIYLKRGNDSLHIPYFAHVISQAVTAGSVMLVDATTSVFQSQLPNKPIQHKDVSSFFENALTAIGKSYTYWNEGVLGPPSLADLKGTSAAIYFTGANLNGFAKENSNYESIPGPLNTIDVDTIDQYLHAGGRVFVTGLMAALSDLNWTALMLGANVGSLSVYDNSNNDKDGTGGMSPPSPSAVPDTRIDKFDNPENPWLFNGMKIDFSTKGDGAGTNVAVNNTTVSHLFDPTWQTVGVAGVTAYSAKDPQFGDSWGEVALRTTDLQDAQTGGEDVATVNSEDPTFKNNPKKPYTGRSVLFTFDFAGIDDNTGFSTRAQVLKRIFDWFSDSPKATVTSTNIASRRPVALQAKVTSLAGVKAVSYMWQIGGTTLKATTKPTKHTFPHAGRYSLRVQVTDSLGHTTVSPWKTVTVH